MGTICNKQAKEDGSEKKVNASKSYTAAPQEVNVIKNVLLTAKNALSHMESFGENFVTDKFSKSLEEHHKTWSDQRYNWFIPNSDIPKNMHEPSSEDFLSSFDVAKALQLGEVLTAKSNLALEIVAEQLGDEAFGEEFLKSKDMARAINVEVAAALKELEIKSTSDVTDIPSFMPDNVANATSGTSRNMRDWFLYRDSVNAFEFMVEVFTKLTK